ncbi:MAG: hypothetical protein IKD75_01675 [Prevotella sp.]|nr:hypothetical protein [Prevotella sp.]
MFNFDYHNPNDNWGYDPYKGMNDDERVAAGCMSGLAYIIAMAIGVLICSLFSSCTTVKYVPVTEQHTEHHWHTDSVKERDSIHTENTTIIREVDSAAMAKYGIQMQANQRAWLVLQREMENRLRELEHMTATHDTIRDSVPVPVPVEVIKEVPAELTWWQQMRLYLANILLYLILIVGIIYVGKKHIKRLRGE